jgi:hypothetical protein
MKGAATRSIDDGEVVRVLKALADPKRFQMVQDIAAAGEPLALTLLAPVVVNIFTFHTFLTPPNPISVFVLIGNAYLGWSYRDAFRPMLAAKARPAVPEESAGGRGAPRRPSSAPSRAQRTRQVAVSAPVHVRGSTWKVAVPAPPGGAASSYTYDLDADPSQVASTVSNASGMGHLF